MSAAAAAVPGARAPGARAAGARAAGATVAIVAQGHTVRIPAPTARGTFRRAQGTTSWVHAATEVSFTARRGEVSAVVGESGCGKTTLALAILGMLPPGTRAGGTLDYVADDGGRTPLTPATATAGAGGAAALRGRTIGYVPQSAATYLTPVRTVGAQLREAVRELGGPASAEQLLERVRLDPAALDAYPHELSGGMLQRAVTACALAGNPDVLVADEPVSGLDPELAALTLGLLRGIAEAGAAVILITHDLQALISTGTADTVSVMYAGRMVESGPAAAVLAAPEHSYTQDLLAALPANGLHPMPGLPPELTDLPPGYSYADRLRAAADTPAGVPGGR